MKSFLFESTVRVTYFLVWAIERVSSHDRLICGSVTPKCTVPIANPFCL